MKLKKVMRYEARQRKLRLFRLMWVKGEPGFGGYSCKLAVALVPKLFVLIYESGAMRDLRLTLLGLSVHYQRSYGGTHV